MSLPTGQFRLVFSPKNYEASHAFYVQGLGLPIDHEWDYGGGDRGIVFLAASGMIELLGLAPGAQYVQPQGVGVLIQVDSADRWHQLAQERSLPVIQEPVTYPWGHRVVRLQDPDGLVVSLFHPV
jgi:catechol 2,3-dioxygenase-like lactoylglutathione lyase family enzyme